VIVIGKSAADVAVAAAIVVWSTSTGTTSGYGMMDCIHREIHHEKEFKRHLYPKCVRCEVQRLKRVCNIITTYYFKNMGLIRIIIAE
jgi:hypothetical protein